MQVHRCRFVEYVPSAISALAFTPRTARPRLACARANGDIDVWNPVGNWLMEKTIPGGWNQSVECLAWVHNTPDESDSESEDEDVVEEEMGETSEPNPAPKPPRLPSHSKILPRLFSSGLNAVVTEYNLASLRPVGTVACPGGAVWSMAVNPRSTMLAVGCDDGTPRLLDVSEGEFRFLRALDRGAGRILAIAWSHDGKELWAGHSDGCIRRWNVETGRILARLTLDSQRGRKDDTLVWALTVLPDGTVVSGDSMGTVTFWDARTGTVIQRFPKAHFADVLCVVASEAGDVVYTGGVDRKIVQFRLTEMGGTGSRHRWVLSGDRRYHSHDIRSIALWETSPVAAIVSGGVDTQMIIAGADKFPMGSVKRMSPFPTRSAVEVCRRKRWVAWRHDRGVKVWRLGECATTYASKLEAFQQLDVASRPQCLFEINVASEARLTCSAISESGEWIALGTIEEVKVFRTKDDGHSLPVIRKHRPTISALSSVPGAFSLAFTPDSRRLVVASPEGLVSVVEVASGEVLATWNKLSGTTVVHLAVSADGQWVAAAGVWERATGTKAQVEVWNLDSMRHDHTLPQPPSHPIHVSFVSHPPATIVVVTHPRHLYLYDVEHRRMADWSNLYNSPLESQIPDRFARGAEPLVGVAHPVPARTNNKGLLQSQNSIAVWGPSGVTWIDLSRHPGGSRVEAKLKRKRDGDTPTPTPQEEEVPKVEVQTGPKISKRQQKKNRKAKKGPNEIVHPTLDDEVGTEPEPVSSADELPHANGTVENGESEDVVVMNTDDEENAALNFMDIDDGNDLPDADRVPEVEQEKEVNAVEARPGVPKAASKEVKGHGGKKGANFVTVRRYQPLMHVDYLSPSELVVVERPWFGIAEKLPGVIRKKKYGT
ncbi:WD40 repeat-like protein [Gonapodya prolifera JEL478]|uniref:WD40 repeat-like protein n=1 Tax=Gonapodya prolifera (strain JEL478) TaxID=1344416 RepID=A0A139APS9_GONPJ|nr:WD40 repeat-like protein [Gonapodya prolifera JEL478]|eukprot:KXS18495.1 WD40 repeat-like protein [Gonapodya prolifera JEL478]